ncbi:MAG: translocation/assembly module TamB domain-containing protein [Bacteroidia bacterium]
MLDLIKDATSDYVFLQSKANSGLFRLGENFALDTIIFDGNIESGKEFDKLTASIYSEQEEGLNRINLKGDARFLRTGAIETRFDSANSWLLLDDIEWDFNADHLVTFIGSHIDVDNLVLHTKGQAIRAAGTIGEQAEDRLSVTGIDLKLSLLNDFFTLPYQFDGDLNATINLDAILDEPLISAEGLILDFMLDEYRYGDLVVNSAWDRMNSKLNMEAELIHEDDSKIKLKGAYRLKNNSPLDFRLITEGAFPLAYVYPFVKTQFYNIEGKVDLEDFTVTGSFKEMIVLGKGEIKDAHIGVDFFQTEYDFGGKVNFERYAIGFKDFVFLDKNLHQAHLGGEIRHRGFSDIFFDMRVNRVNDFLVLDTDKEDNPTYNGTIYIDDATASVIGPIDQIKINAKGTSGAGSILRIPLSGETTIERPDFVRFTGEKIDDRGKAKAGFDGFELNLTVQATPESEVELIFDEKVGDIMRGRGEGTITVRVNEQGEFAMFGDFGSEGDYLFTAQNIVNKRFEVVEGGTITWSGDPYEARLNLDAVYPVYADIQDFLPDVNRPLRTKVNVVMHLDGILLQPEITLDIEIGNINELAAINLAKYLRSIRFDQQELNKQVFSLMVFKRFAIAGQVANVNTIGSEGVTSSISELLSNQFNYWLGQALGDNVNIGLGTDNFKELDFRISAALFNDRVTIERDGALVSEDQNFSLGNISVFIRLTDTDNPAPDKRPGELFLEVFTRENFDYSANRTQRTNQTGIGIYYKKDLDRLLGDLFRKKDQ